MKRLTLVTMIAATLSSCVISLAESRDNESLLTIPPGWTLVSTEDLTLPAGATALYFQHGNAIEAPPLGRGELLPVPDYWKQGNCGLFFKVSRADQRIGKGTKFTVSRRTTLRHAYFNGGNYSLASIPLTGPNGVLGVQCMTQMQGEYSNEFSWGAAAQASAPATIGFLKNALGNILQLSAPDQGSPRK